MNIFEDLPEWIFNSKFVQELFKDYDSDLTCDSGITDERLFEFPEEINRENIKMIVDNIIYFDISENEINKWVYYFLISDDAKHINIDELHVDINRLSFYRDVVCIPNFGQAGKGCPRFINSRFDIC